MKKFRWGLIIFAFVLLGINVQEKDWVAVSCWACMFMLNLALQVEESIKERIDEKFKELKEEKK